MKLPAYVEPKKKTTASPTTGTIFASQGVQGKQYRTRNPSAVDGSTVIVEYEGVDAKGKVILRAFYQNMQEWATVKVDRDYILIPLKEGQMKLPKSKVASTAKPKTVTANSPAALGASTKKNVLETWGVAFSKFGTKADAPKSVPAFMEKEFPGRKTKWAKWTNALRIRFNRSELGVKVAEAEQIPVYGGKREAKPAIKAKKTATAAKSK